jgi:copper chaperone
LLALDAHATVVINRTHNQVQVDSEKTREALAQAITDEGYRVSV